ncbi:hypothetical protein [Romboutsia sp. 1001285H_161024_C4]|uniref:hypothetical protein n=1 Tax=Romboutsia sp. 1001285H_161024_C4 TaxID=2787109 RepID=UPI00189B2CEE|nr:hypothetical protein [Romboutsia sp. 1001285H_161024_C4]
MKCKYFEKTKDGVCVNYTGNSKLKESCSYKCKKIENKGTIPKDSMELIVE